MRLTDLQIKRLRAPEKGQKTYYDKALPGFGIRVSQGGSKSFVVMYGERRRLKTIGRYPNISLADARTEAKRIQSDFSLITEPSSVGLVRKSFIDAREDFLRDSKRRNKASTYGEYRRLLLRYFHFDQSLRTLNRQQIMNSVQSARGLSEARHAYVAIRTMMNWCARHGFIDHSPVPPIPHKPRSRTRILSDDELKAVWGRSYEIAGNFGTLVRLLILTGQRRGEISNLRCSWIYEDTIVFPEEITKNRREHHLPIGSRTADLIESLSGDGGLLFPSRYDTNKPMNGWPKAKREFDAQLAFSDYTLHDLRRTFASNHARLGTPIHVTERMLNHASGTVSGIAAVYNRYSYMDEMREACEKYEAWLYNLISTK